MISGEYTTRIFKLCAFLMIWLLNFIVWSHNANTIQMYAWFYFFLKLWRKDDLTGAAPNA